MDEWITYNINNKYRSIKNFINIHVIRSMRKFVLFVIIIFTKKKIFFLLRDKIFPIEQNMKEGKKSFKLFNAKILIIKMITY